MSIGTKSVDTTDNATWQSHLFSEYDVVIGLKRIKWSCPRIPEHPSVLISKDTATNKTCQANWLDLPDEKPSTKREQSPMDSSMSFSVSTENMRMEQLLWSHCHDEFFIGVNTQSISRKRGSGGPTKISPQVMAIVEQQMQRYDEQPPINCIGISKVCSSKIAYWSQQLNKAERNYSTIEREALGAVAAIKEFFPYLYGRWFTLLTDHNPLMSLRGLKDTGD
ncbi:hypothetical protein EMCRGX_G005565 [Ephydatia muelleri]